MDSTFAAVLTGTSPFAADGFTQAVAARFLLITEAGEGEASAFDHKAGEFCYDGNRCRAENLGWRTAQTVGYEASVDEIAAGNFDAEIAVGFHEAASSEHYYRYEKDWG